MREQFEEAMRVAYGAAQEYVRAVDGLHVGARGGRQAGDAPLPNSGVGAPEALRDLIARAADRSVATSGPRFFHYVVGGVTPAALGADWLASTWDQVASSASGSPLGVELEVLVTRWLAELFNIDPDAYTGVLTSGATMANFVGLGAARQWWGEQHGIDVAEDGLAGAPPLRILTSGFVHAAVIKSLAMLGVGRSSVEKFSVDNRGTLDVKALEARLEDLGDAPSIIVATAGEVNAGGFDPMHKIAALATRFPVWVHVDGAFGLFARVSGRTEHLLDGLECAHSIASDAHKWMNVPYDCGFAFVAGRAHLAKTFRMKADYLPPAADGDERVRVPANLGPESSRRARALPLFATLLAQGRNGVREMVEGHLDLAQSLADRVRSEPDLALVDEPILNVVPFRCAPKGVRKRDLDALNQAVGDALLREGRVFAGLTRYRSVLCFRPAIANWRTREEDIALLVERVCALCQLQLDASQGPS